MLGDPAPAAAAAAPSSPRAGGPSRWRRRCWCRPGIWQGARLAGGPHLPAERAWALASCVVTPGFDYADFELADREALLAAYPRLARWCEAFT